MRTSYINTNYRAAVIDNCLFISHEKTDSMILKVTNIIPSVAELDARQFDSLQEYFDIDFGS
jgi:hypothetical protein